MYIWIKCKIIINRKICSSNRAWCKVKKSLKIDCSQSLVTLIIISIGCNSSCNIRLLYILLLDNIIKNMLINNNFFIMKYFILPEI